MKTIIAGSRTITEVEVIISALLGCPFTSEISEVVSGTAKGVDLLGEQVAKATGIPIKRFPANWEQYGKAAGPIRNNEMAEYADALVAIWDGKSSGTKHMIDSAKSKGLNVYVYVYREGMIDGK